MNIQIQLSLLYSIQILFSTKPNCDRHQFRDVPFNDFHSHQNLHDHLTQYHNPRMINYYLRFR